MASVYLQVNASLLLESLKLGEVEYLTPGEVKKMSESQLDPKIQHRPWEYWAGRAGRSHYS